ncbi:MAG: zinc ribbon domain-containing protein [Desulfuromonadales bacterium]
MFCGPGAGWGGWHMGGWFMPGFFILILFAVVVFLLLRRQSSPAAAKANCPKCAGSIHAAYFRCPHCGETLKHNCPNCSRIMEYEWAYCPYCNEDQARTDEKPETSTS